jgi:hypothetical protein
VVERRPEKAGVASSILAPGTISATTISDKLHALGGDAGSPFRGESNFVHVLRDSRAPAAGLLSASIAGSEEGSRRIARVSLSRDLIARFKWADVLPLTN